MSSDPKPARTYQALTPGQALDGLLGSEAIEYRAGTVWRQVQIYRGCLKELCGDSWYVIPRDVATILIHSDWRRVKEQGE